jgi:hypothetical protein
MFAVTKRLPALIAALSVAALAGCSSNNDDDNAGAPAPAAAPPTGQAFVEVIHASADAPPVNILVNGAAAFTDVDFKEQVSATLDAGTIEVEVVGLLPNDGEVTVIPAAGEPTPALSLAADSRVTVFAIGDVAEIAPYVIVDSSPDVPADEVRVRVLHAAPDAGQVEVFVTNPDANIVSPAGTDTVISAVFDFGQELTSNALQVPAGDYRVRVTRPGAPGAVLFDSGLLPLPGGANLVIAAVPNTTAGLVRNAPSPITLVASTGAGLLEIVNDGTPATVRVVHASSNTPPVDVVVGGSVAIPGLTYLASFGGEAVTAALPEGDYVFDVAVSPYNPGDAFPLSEEETLVAGEAKSVLAIGSLDGTSATQPGDFPLKTVVLDDQTRSIATAAQVRIIHASVLAGAVDIYVQPGNTLLMGEDIADGTAAFLENVPYEAVTPYVQLAEGSYDIAVTGAGSKTPAIGPLTVGVDAGGIYTIIALDGENQTAPTAAVLNDSL